MAFFASVLTLLLGFAFSFHLIVNRSGEKSNSYNNPISAFMSILTVIVGDYSQKGHSDLNNGQVPGTTEVLFVLLFFGK